MRIRGPFGLSRIAETRVLEARAPTSGAAGELTGRADVGPTVGRVNWRIEPRAGGSEVTLMGSVEHAGRLDRALLTLGGRWWLRRIFESAVRRLDEVL